MLLDLDSSSLWYIQGCYMGYPSKSILAFWWGLLVLKRIIKFKLFHWKKDKDILSRESRKIGPGYWDIYVLWNWLMSTSYIWSNNNYLSTPFYGKINSKLLTLLSLLSVLFYQTTWSEIDQKIFIGFKLWRRLWYALISMVYAWWSLATKKN